MTQDELFKVLVAHCKEYGFIFPSSEIYDGLAAVYDYGQMGVELKNNIKQYWWQAMTRLNENIVGIDSCIFMHPRIWEASGHVSAFNDPLIDNKDSKKRYRADVLIEDYLGKIEEKIEIEEVVEEKKDAAPVAARICKQCGEEVAPGHRFCGSCGAKYEEERVATGIGEDIDSSNKRTVERPSFVFNAAVPTEQKLAQFRLHQINDDGTLGDLIPLYEGENVVGRISSPMLNNDRFVNPKHVKITCHDDVAILEDNNSLNGVFLRLCDTSAAVYDGDTFRIGEELLNYCHGSSSQPILKSRAEENTTLIGGKEGEGWGYLRVIIGAFSEGSVYRLDKDTVKIGRTQGDIVFARDGFVSGTHASFERQGDHALLKDLGSSNGTFLRIKAPLTVTETAHILIGNKLLRIARVV